MNEVLKAIKERRSIRSFKKEMPPKEMIDQIIEAGLYAPSGKNLQEVITICVTDPQMRERFEKANRQIGGYAEDFDPFYGAPVILVVLAKKDNKNHVYDGSLVMGNLMLATHALGLGGIWINRAKQEFETDEFKQILKDLGIEGEWEGIGHCAVGYIDGENPPAPKRKEDRVYYIG
ncbi:MAG: nitroreductase [Erysipelotrichaceae bacterium]|nr:nitroreductase [Erysipelotrichaceae bacterium]